MSLSASKLFSFLDLTTLISTDSESNVKALIDFALEQQQNGFQAAAICVYSNFAEVLLENLQGSSIKSAVVAGAFPHGQALNYVKNLELKELASMGIEEIDVVLNRGLFLSGQREKAQEDLVQMRNSASDVCLKVILETGELSTADNIREAAYLAMDAGADFIKTSTGKSAVGATPDAVRVMCEAVKAHFDKTSKKVGVKVSGGVRTEADAQLYAKIVGEILGTEWLSPALFRIGASSLAHDLIG